MKRTGREFKPWAPKVTKIELSEKYIKPRGILALLCLIFGIALMGYGLMSALETEAGWQEIQSGGSGLTCTGDFQLMYDLPQENTTAVKKQLANLYTQAGETSYRVFSPDVEEEGLGNVAYLNSHVNETVTVEEPLYRALCQVLESGNRQVFTAPAVERYRLVFSSDSDAEAALYDPETNSELGAWMDALAEFVSDPRHISLEVYGDCRVQLKVSQEYLAFARENEIQRFLDFDWMTNAFRADYLADTLVENGFAQGYLTSVDGFTRNFDSRGTVYRMGLITSKSVGETLLSYSSPKALAYLCDFDPWGTGGYIYADGRRVHPMLDAEDCRSKAAVESLLVCSDSQSCGEMVLTAGKAFAGDTLDAQSLSSVQAVWWDGETLFCNDENLRFDNVAVTYLP